MCTRPLKYVVISATVDSFCLVSSCRSSGTTMSSYPVSLIPRSWVMMNGVEQLVTMRKARPPVKNCMPLSPWVPMMTRLASCSTETSSMSSKIEPIRTTVRTVCGYAAAAFSFQASMRKRASVISFLEPMMWSNMISLLNAFPTTMACSRAMSLTGVKSIGTRMRCCAIRC